MYVQDQSRDLDPALQSVVDKVQKLLNVAAKAGTPEEAASFTEKAMAMLEAYNLDMGTVERKAGADMKREEQKLAAGMYEWQRDLWQAVARLNFCLSFHLREWRKKTNPNTGKEFGKVRLRNTMRVIGKTVNVRVTIHMVEYLSEAIERAVWERYPKNERQHYGDEIMTYRDGLAANVYNRLLDRRDQLLAAEREKAEAAAAAGATTSTALTLASVAQTEEDANNDFLYGEGWSAKQRQDREDRARKRKEAEEAYTKWASENPEEAAEEQRKLDEKRKEANEAYRKAGGPGSRGGRGYSLTAAEKRRENNPNDYHRGYRDGARISLDTQVGKREQKLLK